MIYTVTLNPAIDISLRVREGLVPGCINKSYGMRTDPGGKGINVSKTLKALGEESVICIGFCGADGDRLIKSLENEYTVLGVNYPSGNTRTNIKITDGNGVTTDVNADGPSYDAASIEKLKKLITSGLKRDDIVVICGRPPQDSPSDIYADLIRTFSKTDGVKVILDCSGRYLQKGLDAVPFAVKPTCDELGLANDPECAFDEASKIVAEGITWCLVSMGREGAVFVNDARQKYYSKALEVKVNCTTGCGDAMTAGLAYALDKKMSSGDTFRICMALATAAAETEGTTPPSRERVMELFDNIPFCGQ